MLAVAYLVAGSAAVVTAVWGLAGPWWGVLTLGVLLLTVGVLEARGPGPSPEYVQQAARELRESRALGRQAEEARKAA